jgi:anti-sigma factor RsiW
MAVSPYPIPANDRAADAAAPPFRICFFFNAQRHQLLHGISTAVELARRPGFEVHVASPSEDHIAYARGLAERLGGAPIHCAVTSPLLLRALYGRSGRSVPPKLLSLGLLARHLDRFDAIAIPERTTVQLKLFGARSPHYIHLDHGAGDRAAGFDPRIRHFDMVLMAGEKHRERLGREGLIREGRHAVVGYPKFDAADAIRNPAWSPFANDRPIVLYNPHFSRLGSWEAFGVPILRNFAAQDRYNLIVAPHVRMLDGRKKRARWDALIAEYGRYDHILIDTGSDRSIDMSYTARADLYIGDVSSQVYEFLRTPKPCLFLDAHGVDWRDNEDYAHWRFGPVARSAGRLLDQVDAALAGHDDYADAQVAGFRETFATGEATPSVRAAAAIADYLAAHAVPRSPAAPSLSIARRIQRAAVLALAIGAGWIMNDAVGPLTSPAQAETAFVDRAVRSHETTRIRAAMKSQPEVPALDRHEIRSATGIRLPQLPKAWRLTDVQVYPSTVGPLVQIAAITDRGEAISLVAMRVNTPAEATPLLSDRDGDDVAYWEEGEDAYGIVGALPAARLLTLASDLAKGG